ncbi:hypothetical protein DWQ65_10405 [Treponema phagedenis]|nr:hypothetical protein FUT79_13790 [Treponema phagedenis]QEK02126.1 hypothetical protein FUT84_13800 [Treponema phagedenis]QEK07399.1 hypothetical protein FUT80_12160 [Treponema phagedenis]QSH94121.1 hypothetical protein C5O78_03500 [Treponema phagedenis]QSI00460.1 hypothetical protein DWQ65_10405 [Treponema phagedenis]
MPRKIGTDKIGASILTACRFSITVVNCSPLSSSERARTFVVPNRIEFENYHSYINRSFQTHRFHFSTDGGGSKQKRRFKAK